MAGSHGCSSAHTRSASRASAGWLTVPLITRHLVNSADTLSSTRLQTSATVESKVQHIETIVSGQVGGRSSARAASPSRFWPTPGRPASAGCPRISQCKTRSPRPGLRSVCCTPSLHLHECRAPAQRGGVSTVPADFDSRPPHGCGQESGAAARYARPPEDPAAGAEQAGRFGRRRRQVGRVFGSTFRPKPGWLECLQNTSRQHHAE